MLRFVVLALVVAYVSAKTPYKTCLKPDSTTFLDVGGCTTSTCIMTRGSTVHVKATFKAPFAADAVYEFHDVIVNSTPFPVDSKNACGEITSTPGCPLVAGTSYTLEHDFDIPKDSPTGDGTTTVTRKDKKGNVLSCYIYNIKIV